MLNKEKFSRQIVEVACNGETIALRNGRVTSCEKIACEDCDWRNGYCEKNKKEWANSEYIEKPTLTSDERKFCELVKTGYLVRDCNNYNLYWTDKEVDKVKGSTGLRWATYGRWTCIKNIFPTLDFGFIDSEDEEPWKVEDLLQLEYEE